MTEMQKQVSNLKSPSEGPTRRQKAFSYFKEKREWVKLNASYVLASTTNFGVAIGSAHIAQKAGFGRENAASWVAFASGFMAGFAVMVASWYFMHVDKYQKDVAKIAKDAITMFKNIWKAQAISFGVVIPTSWLLAKESLLHTAAIVAIQQVLDRIIFIPAFNFFSRRQVREMEKQPGGPQS